MGSLQDEYEKGLEDALQQALTKYTEQSRRVKLSNSLFFVLSLPFANNNEDDNP